MSQSDATVFNSYEYAQKWIQSQKSDKYCLSHGNNFSHYEKYIVGKIIELYKTIRLEKDNFK